MNAFDYWFDYIVRNGEFVKNKTILYEWKIQTKNIEYWAVHDYKAIFSKYIIAVPIEGITWNNCVYWYQNSAMPQESFFFLTSLTNMVYLNRNKTEATRKENITLKL